MERPELIEQKIEELKKQLKESENHYHFQLVCNSNKRDEMIGLFNIGNTKKILNLLTEGRRLQYRHSLGNYIVFMNQNKNRILVKNDDDTELESIPYNEFKNTSTVIVYKSPINENTIMSYIIWGTGEWYLDTHIIYPHKEW